MNAKYIVILGIALASGSGYIYNNFQAEKLPTVESIRNQAQEARIRAEEAEKNRMAAEDKLSQALYDSCYSKAITLSGMTFDEKQRRTYDCWREELTKTNGTGKLAPASEPPSRPIISNSSQNVTDKSTIGPDKKGQSTRIDSHDQVLGASQTSGQQVATTVQHRSEVQRTQAVSPSGGTGQKGKSTDYWLAYETAVKLIHRWEGLRLSAYKDVKQCSIGYGFYWSKIPKDGKCKGSISQKKADAMLAESLQDDISIIRTDFPTLHAEAHGALASFKHNCPAGYQSIRKNGLKWFNSWCKSADGERLQGLVNRRAAEWNIVSPK